MASRLQKARQAVLDLIKAKPLVQDDEDEDEDDEGGAPSQLDAEKDAAPQQNAAPQGDADSDADGDGEPDEDDDDDGEDTDGDGQDEDAPPPPLPMKGKKPPVTMKPPVMKSVAALSDDEMLAEILRRTESAPAFLKSLSALPQFEEVLDAIDMSDVVGLLVQQFGQQIAEAHARADTLQKSLDAFTERFEEQEQTSEVLLQVLAKSIQNQEALTKSLSGVAEGVALLKSQDNGKVSHGTGMLRAPVRTEPGEAPTGEDTLLRIDKGKALRVLMKSLSDESLTEAEATRLMGEVDGATGPVGVYQKLQKSHPAVAALML